MTEKLPDNENCRIGRVAWKFADSFQKKKAIRVYPGEILKNKKIPLCRGFICPRHSGLINLRMDFRIHCKYLHQQLKTEIAGKKPHRKSCRILPGRMANSRY